MSQTTCPVFRPTLKEFESFSAYVSSIENENKGMGICKIIPPDGWTPGNGIIPLQDILKLNININVPVRQVVTGRAGIFSVNLFEVNEMHIQDIYDYSLLHACDSGDTYEDIERKFWKSLGNPSKWSDPIYGADLPGSVFQDILSTHPWNIDKLDSLLRLIGHEIPGVTRAMLYIGTWRAMFAFHTEDYDLHSINYLHHGAAKSWYSIPYHYKTRFESMCKGYYTEEFNECHEFLRHKTKLFSPKQFRDAGIEYKTVVQEEGEFVITFPGSYHAGFNHGFNVAEATNFTLPSWFKIGLKSKRCICRPNAVQFDVELLETKYCRHIAAYGCYSSRNSPTSNGSNNSKHAYSNDEYSHRVRCICKSEKFKQEDELLQCTACLLKFHKVCVRQLDGGCDSLCHICQTIENVHTAAVVTPITTEGSSSVDYSNISGTDGASLAITSMLLADVAAVKRRRGKGKSIQIGDIVNASVPESTNSVVATVSDIEDNLIRIHRKGTKKTDDVWTPLDWIITNYTIDAVFTDKPPVRTYELFYSHSPSIVTPQPESKMTVHLLNTHDSRLNFWTNTSDSSEGCSLSLTQRSDEAVPSPNHILKKRPITAGAGGDDEPRSSGQNMLKLRLIKKKPCNEEQYNVHDEQLLQYRVQEQEQQQQQQQIQRQKEQVERYLQQQQLQQQQHMQRQKEQEEREQEELYLQKQQHYHQQRKLLKNTLITSPDPPKCAPIAVNRPSLPSSDAFFSIHKEALRVDASHDLTSESNREYRECLIRSLCKLRDKDSLSDVRSIRNVLTELVMKCKLSGTKGFITGLCIYSQQEMYGCVSSLAAQYYQLIADSNAAILHDHNE